MIRFISGDTGEGKTKTLIKLANDSKKLDEGHIVYLDAGQHHLYHLKHQIRYTNLTDFPITDYNEFFGFICGILSEDNDISEIYADGLLKLSHVPSISQCNSLIEKLNNLSEKFNVKLIMSINCVSSNFPDFMKEYIV